MEQQIIDLAVGHKWFALAAVLIGLFVRLLKSDASFFPTLPEAWKKWKPAIAIALGVTVGVLNALATGTPWVDAIVSGVVAGLLPVFGHQLFIERLRDGKELPVSLPPSGPVVIMVAFLGLGSQGCAGSFEEAKLAGRGYSASASVTPPSARCQELDDARGQWSALAKAAGVVSGAGGLASIPVNPEARPYVVGGVVVFLTAGAYALIRSESASAAWVRECSQ